MGPILHGPTLLRPGSTRAGRNPPAPGADGTANRPPEPRGSPAGLVQWMVHPGRDRIGRPRHGGDPPGPGDGIKRRPVCEEAGPSRAGLSTPISPDARVRHPWNRRQWHPYDALAWRRLAEGRFVWRGIDEGAERLWKDRLRIRDPGFRMDGGNAGSSVRGSSIRNRQSDPFTGPELARSLEWPRYRLVDATPKRGAVQYAPLRFTTTTKVLQMIRRSRPRDQFRTYSTSRSTMRA